MLFLAFIFGMIAGILGMMTVFIVIAYFKIPLQFQLKRIEQKISAASPRQKGAIIFPKDDATLAREEIIAKRKAAGLDTPISELQ